MVREVKEKVRGGDKLGEQSALGKFDVSVLGKGQEHPLLSPTSSNYTLRKHVVCRIQCQDTRAENSQKNCG